MKSSIGITDKNRQALANILNMLLADEVLLYIKTRKFHWNVTGPQFNDLHKFFEGQYEQLDEIMDSVAERSRQLDHFALGSMKQFLKAARLVEHTDDTTSASTMIKNLVDDHETLIRILRKDLNDADEKYKDAGTSDFLTGIMQEHEKMAWMLRSYLAGK